MGRMTGRGAAMGVSVLACAGALGQVDMLPDIIVDPERLYNNFIEEVGDRVYLRLANGTANIGAGPLHLRGGEVTGPDRQRVYQRIFRSDGSWWEREAGEFLYHPGHNHVHVDDWAVYRLREILPGDEVGEIIAEGPKTSFCIFDMSVYDETLPGFPPGGFYDSCTSTTQGLSVGWIDVYGASLPGQAIDVTGVEDGTYWLESVVDPNNNMLESDETNNVARIKVTIGSGGPLTPDRYEPNDTRAQVDGRAEGAINSPNLGPVGPVTTIDDLSIHAPGNDDWYRFYMPATGTSEHYVRITFQHSLGDLDMELYNAAGTLVGISQSVTNVETISMSGLPRGWYYVRVYGWADATNPLYAMTIVPSQNQPPQITMLTPPEGDTHRHHGDDTYLVEWVASDPDGDPTWVTLFVNDVPELNGGELLVESTVSMPGHVGAAALNSAEFPPGTWWVYGRITDGGVVTGSWSPGTITFEAHGCEADMTGSADPNHPDYGVPDGVVDASDFFFYLDMFAAGDSRADMTTSSDPNDPFYGVPDGVIDANDFFYFLDRFVEGCP